MDKLKLSYSEAYVLVNKLLKKEKKLASFCREHGIAYQELLSFRNRPKVQRIKTLHSILKAYGYKLAKTEKVVYIHIFKPKLK